jgi:eight-cysteine-cluster-containing protein
MRVVWLIAAALMAVSGCIQADYGAATTTTAAHAEGRCSAASDCEGRLKPQCPGSWSCESGRCEWDCSAAHEPTTTIEEATSTTVAAAPTLISYRQSPCPDNYGAGRYGNEISIVRIGDAIEVSHLLDYVCCANVSVSMNQSTYDGGTSISLLETNIGGMCRCICGYNVTVVIGGVPAGRDVSVRIYGVEYSGQGARLLGEASTNTRISFEGNTCGGEAGRMCAAGLECDYSGNLDKDAEGVCAKRTQPGRIMGLGMMCGGIAGFVCETGLECKMEGDYPDAAGTCVEADVPPVCMKDSDCVIGGCSGQLCSPKSVGPIISTCEYRKEYGCYKMATCGCVGGRCEWMGGADFDECLGSPDSGPEGLP